VGGRIATAGGAPNYGVPMFRNLDEPRKARRVGVVLATVAAVYLGLTAIAVIGVMVDGPVKVVVVKVAGKPAVTLENCNNFGGGVAANDCRRRNKDVRSAAAEQDLSRASAGQGGFKEVPDWPMRAAISGGVLLVASFFFSIVVGLAAIVARLSGPRAERTVASPGLS